MNVVCEEVESLSRPQDFCDPLKTKAAPSDLIHSVDLDVGIRFQVSHRLG
jgi:hypothetical protein